MWFLYNLGYNLLTLDIHSSLWFYTLAHSFFWFMALISHTYKCDAGNKFQKGWEHLFGLHRCAGNPIQNPHDWHWLSNMPLVTSMGMVLIFGPENTKSIFFTPHIYSLCQSQKNFSPKNTEAFLDCWCLTSASYSWLLPCVCRYCTEPFTPAMAFLCSPEPMWLHSLQKNVSFECSAV